jgi:hypothetical protein
LFLEIDFTKEDIKYLEKINGIIEKVIGKVWS